MNEHYKRWMDVREENKKRVRIARAEGFVIPPEWCVWRSSPKKRACFFCLEKLPAACSLRLRTDRTIVGYVCDECMRKVKLRSFIVDDTPVLDSGPQRQLALR